MKKGFSVHTTKSKKKNITVSIVEDDTPVREIVAAWLKQAKGFECLGRYGNVEQALERLPAEEPSVVLMDINLPGMSGIEGVRRLRPLLPETQFVMLTTYQDPDHVFGALAAGATGYLLKETPRRELLKSIKDVYAGGSPMTGNIARQVVQAFHLENLSASDSGKFSHREGEVFGLLARGYLYKEISDMLGLTRSTVNTYVQRIYGKLRVRSRGQAVAKLGHFSLNDSAVRRSRICD